MKSSSSKEIGCHGKAAHPQDSADCTLRVGTLEHGLHLQEALGCQGEQSTPDAHTRLGSKEVQHAYHILQNHVICSLKEAMKLSNGNPAYGESHEQSLLVTDSNLGGECCSGRGSGANFSYFWIVRSSTPPCIACENSGVEPSQFLHEQGMDLQYVEKAFKEGLGLQMQRIP